MVDIEVTENGIAYACSVEEYDIIKYIKKNEDMNCLNDEQKILKAIYEMWLEDKGVLILMDYDIPENSPYYGKKYSTIENISLNDIRWIDDKTPSDILRKQEIELECISALEEALEIRICYISKDIGGDFLIGIDDTKLCFDGKNFDFIEGNFYGKYRLKKNRPEIIEKVHNAICKNMKLIQEYCAF